MIDRLLQETFEPEFLTAQPSLAASDSCSLLVEVPALLSIDCCCALCLGRPTFISEKIVPLCCHQRHATHGHVLMVMMNDQDNTSHSAAATVGHVHGCAHALRDRRLAV